VSAAPGGPSLAIGAALYRWRSAPEPTGSRHRVRCRCRSVRRLPGPFAAAVTPVSTSTGSLCRRFDGYSSRSQPVLRDVARRMAGRRPGVKRGGAAARSFPARRIGGPDFIAGAAKDRECRIARVSRIRLRALAQAERGAASGLDDPGVPTRAAQTGRRHGAHVAERVGFEPTKSFDSALFKSAAINRSATSPRNRIPAVRKVLAPGVPRLDGVRIPRSRPAPGTAAAPPAPSPIHPAADRSPVVPLRRERGRVRTR
jgi:hypothetical protein